MLGITLPEHRAPALMRLSIIAPPGAAGSPPLLLAYLVSRDRASGHTMAKGIGHSAKSNEQKRADTWGKKKYRLFHKSKKITGSALMIK